MSGYVNDVLDGNLNAVERAVRGAQWRLEKFNDRIERATESLGPLISGKQLQVGDLAGALATFDRSDQLACVFR